MGDYSKHNAGPVLANVEAAIKGVDSRWSRKYPIREVCDDLSIFDWWPDEIGATGLKAMRSFIKNAIRLGFDGYVCFKVGAKGCASGMWAYKKESQNGYSPDGPCIYRSFYSTGNYYDACDSSGHWLTTDTPYDEIKTVRQLEKAMQGLEF